MRSKTPRSVGSYPLFVAAMFILSASLYGCSTSESTTEQWETPMPSVTTARLEYRIDSLTNENRRLKQQLDAMAIENRKVTARNAELEMKLDETAAAPALPPTAEQPMPPVKKERAAPPGPTGDLPSRYSDALQTYRNRDFSGAAQQFEALLNSNISRDLVDHCHYWIGQCYYDMKKYNEALPHFETILDMSTADKKPDAQLMIANCYLAMGNTAAAKQAYQKFLSTYPTSPYVRKAQERLSRIK